MAPAGKALQQSDFRAKNASGGVPCYDPRAVARLTGVNFSNALAFVRERFPHEGMVQVLSRLSPADRAFLAGEIRDAEWYDLGAYLRLIRTIDATLGAGDLSLLPVLGRFEAERDRNTVQGLFLRIASPTWAVRLVTEFWGQFHDSGRWTVRREGETTLHGVLEDFGAADPAMCAELCGYIARVMEFAGAQQVVMKHPECRGHGASACHFLLTWQR